MKKWGLCAALFLIPALGQSQGFLTDPILQNPTTDSVNIVWFTEFEGEDHYVEYGEEFAQKIACQTKKLSRMREDDLKGCKERSIYRHEATLKGISPIQRTPYRVISVISKIETIKSSIFSCAPSPKEGTALKILFTSDHQLKPMVAANLQKVKEMIPQVDAVFFAGDNVDHPDKASEWFDHPEGGSFFPCLQGKASRKIGNTVYTGGSLLQSAPIFCTIGNHEVMGRWSMENSLNAQFNDPYPKEAAEKDYRELFPDCSDTGHQQTWIKDHSYNTDSYDEIFTLPRNPIGGSKYYAVTFGDIRLVVLYATRIWRNTELEIKGKYAEDSESFSNPAEWGYGDFIFESIEKGSDQYRWLENELQSDAFQRSRYKIIMLHNALHTLGGNAVPPYANPVQEIERNARGEITSIQYHYPKDQDILIRDIEPLLIKYGVQLVLCGHSHVWNRFKTQGVHHLETSNVGNSYGAYYGDIKRTLIPEKEDDNYVASGDPNGLSPILPTIAPLSDVQGTPLPYVSSNEITVFSVFSTDSGAVDSYYFDTAKPESEVVHFDRFFLDQNDEAIIPIASITAVKEYAQTHGFPQLIVFDIDNTLIESARQIGLDPSVNSFLREQFPENSEVIIRGVQSAVPWKLCETMTAEVVKFFQERGVKMIGVTKRSSEMKEQVLQQLKSNGIDLEKSTLLTQGEIAVAGGIYYRGVLHAQSDKGSALKALFQHVDWDYREHRMYCVDDRKSHLADFQKQFGNQMPMISFEYIYSHKQHVDKSILQLQLHDFLSGKNIREDSFYDVLEIDSNSK